MDIDRDNKEFFYALKLVEEKGLNIFLTGKAGTGKTTFLRYLKTTSRKNIVIAAPTGVAAINAGGMTIHSLFQINPGSLFYYDDHRLRKKSAPGDKNKDTIYDHFKLSANKREILKNVDILVIDEVSMVRCELLDVIDKVLRAFGGNENLPFGGKQIILIGDGFQLPPVVKNDVKDILGIHYDNFFFFGSKSFQTSSPQFIELEKIYRQKNDKVFIDLLNRIRINEVTSEDIQTLNRLVDQDFDFSRENYIFLGTHNAQVEQTNSRKLSELNTELKIFQATVSGNFPDDDMPTAKKLELKVGAQVMFVKNDTGTERRYFNGKIGKISKINDNGIWVDTQDSSGILVERAIWEKIEYRWDEKEKKVVEKVVGSFTQYPLKLAWAITIHKSQGLTFERVYADITDAFAPGQVYVALSRCTSLEGLKLARPISRTCISTDPHVIDFYKKYQQLWIETKKNKERPPVISFFNSSKSLVSNGESAVLKWDVSGAERVEISSIGLVSSKGERELRPRQDGNYKLTAVNDFSFSTSRTISVKVSKEPPKILLFQSSHSYIFEGLEVELSWKVSNAEKVEINPMLGLVTNEGRRKVQINEMTTFTLMATTFYGVSRKYSISINTLPVPIIERILAPELTVSSVIDISMRSKILPEITIPSPEGTGASPVFIEMDETNLVKHNFLLNSNQISFPQGYFQKLIIGFETYIEDLVHKLKKTFDQ